METALEAGYRHIDTATIYGNEEAVGMALETAQIPREQLWITSKVWYENLAPDAIKKEVDESLERLQLDYLDLMLIHWPNPQCPLEASIQTLAELREAGRIRQLGVSNFPSSLLKEALAYGPVFCNQVEYHPMLGQDELLKVTRPHDILLTAYSPLAHGIPTNETLTAIGQKYGKSASQVALRWLIEQDRVVTVPRSSKPDHIRSNIDLFDFELDREDLLEIESLPKDKRQTNPEWAPRWD